MIKYAIIAAGEGSRLAKEGIAVPKPLVRIAEETLIDRLIRIFQDQGATEIDVICNQRDEEVCRHLRRLQSSLVNCQLSIIQKSTPSSMHSLFELSSLLDNNPFVLTTVDTVFREEEFRRYVETFKRILLSGEADGLMGVTDYIDDECPLYVQTDDAFNITAFLDRNDHPRYVSGGIYGLTPTTLQTLCACVARGESRMRNFQRAMLTDSLRLKAYPFTTILDVDHASDIHKANTLLT